MRAAALGPQLAKAAFWNTTDFYGLNLTSLQGEATADYFSQPIVGYFDTSILLSSDIVTHTIDFQKDTVADLAEINVPLRFTVTKTGMCVQASERVCVWVGVGGVSAPVELSTSCSTLHRVCVCMCVLATELMHGIAAWFDVSFNGRDKTVVLSTSPSTPGTHWYQCRLLLQEPIAVNATQTVSGHLKMTVNDKFSYHIVMTCAYMRSRADGVALV